MNMVMLVSLAQASEHLRRDTSDDDADLTLKIMAASQAVLNYIDPQDFFDSYGDVTVDSAGDPVGVPEAIQQAVLYMVGVFYKDRDATEYTEPRAGADLARTGINILPRAVHFLLDPYRTPTIA